MQEEASPAYHMLLTMVLKQLRSNDRSLLRTIERWIAWLALAAKRANRVQPFGHRVMPLGWEMLEDASPAYLTYPMSVLKHLSSNGIYFSYCNAPFVVERGAHLVGSGARNRATRCGPFGHRLIH